MAKGKKNKMNTYNSGMNNLPYSQATLPPIIPNIRNKPKTKEEYLEEQFKKAQLEKKRKALKNNRKYYQSKLEGKASKKAKEDPNKKYRLEKEKRIKKGRDYFFIMRKSVCFFLFLFFAVPIALFVLGYMEIEPQYTSLYVEPDYTPEEERLSEEVDGEVIEYEDQSVYYSTVEPLFGFLKKYNIIDLGESPKFDIMQEKVEAGLGDKVAAYAMTYYPVAMVLYIIVALISMIKAFLGMFGRRIYKMFGLSAIWMIIFAAIVVIAGAASNMTVEQESFDYAQILPFLTSSITTAMSEDLPDTAAGFGLIGMVGIPIIILILSLFTKKKVPYSIFD